MRTRDLILRHVRFPVGAPVHPFSLPSLALLQVAQEFERLLGHLLAGLEPLLDLDHRDGLVRTWACHPGGLDALHQFEPMSRLFNEARVSSLDRATPRQLRPPGGSSSRVRARKKP